MSATIPNFQKSPPARTLAQKALSALKGGNSSFKAASLSGSNSNTVEVARHDASGSEPPGIEQLGVEDPFGPSEGTEAVIPPNGGDVKGKLLSINYALFIAGLNGAFFRLARSNWDC